MLDDEIIKSGEAVIWHLRNVLNEMEHGKFETTRPTTDGELPVVAIQFDALKSAIERRIKALERFRDFISKVRATVGEVPNA